MEKRESTRGLLFGTGIFVALILVTRVFGATPAPPIETALEQSDFFGNARQPKAASRHNSDPQAILHDARAALKGGDENRAASILVRLPASDGASHFAAGAMLVELKAYALAAREFGIARQTYKDPYTAAYDETLAYVNAENYAAALVTANELLSHGYRTAELAELAATAYRKSGQTQEAYNALRLATHLNPKYEDAYVELCQIALDKDNYDVGLQIAGIGLSNLPSSSRLYLQRGVMRAMKGQFPDAEQDFSKAAQFAPDDVHPAVALGLLAMQLGHLNQAVEALRGAATRHPDNYLAQYWFSKALEHSGAAAGTKDWEQILTALQASVRLNPNFWHARADLGKILLDRGTVDGAIVELQKAVDLNPSATAPLYLLAQAYRRKGDDSRARDLMARVSNMQTEERESLAHSTLKGIVREEGTTAPAVGQIKP